MPASARNQGHAVRPPTWDLLKAQINHEVDRLIDSKIQNHEVMSVFHQIDKATSEAEQRRQRAKELAASAIESLEAGAPNLSAQLLTNLMNVLISQGEALDTIGGLVQEGISLELTDVKRDDERTGELQVRDHQVKTWRLGDKGGVR